MKTKLSSKGQIVIPKEIREELHLRPGDELEIRAENSVVVIEAAATETSGSLDALIGCLHRPGRRTRTVEEMHKAIGKAARASWNHDRD